MIGKLIIAVFIIGIIYVVRTAIGDRRRRKERLTHAELDRRFPRQFHIAILILLVLAGCTGRVNLGPAASDPPSLPGDPSGGGPSGPSSPGAPIIVEVIGCANVFTPPQEFEPLSCQLKQPIQIGDAVKVVYWTQASVGNANKTLKVSDPNQTVYAGVVSVPETGSTNNTVWIASGVSPLASPSLNVTVDPQNTDLTNLADTAVEDIVLVHTRGAVTFRNVVSTGCLAPASPSSPNGITNQTCLPILGPQITPNQNDLVLAVFISNQPIFDQMSISTSAFNPPISLAWAFSNSGSFAVGSYVATNTTPIQPSFSLNTGLGTQLNTNFGWDWTALVADFY